MLFKFSSLLLSLLTVLIALVWRPAESHAGRIPVVVVWGGGEELVQLGELPDTVATSVNQELGTDVKVGFLYERFHIFWCDVWTWNGRQVLFAGDTYWELEPNTWQELLGSDQSAQFGKPILYTIPLGSGILVVLGVLYVAGKRFWKSDEERVQALLMDDQYRSATEILFGPTDADVTANDDQRPDQQRFNEAVRYLVGQGISSTKAEANLDMIARVGIESRGYQVEQLFEMAAQLDQDGQWDQSAELYTRLIEYLSEDDNRARYAGERLAAINEKLETAQA